MTEKDQFKRTREEAMTSAPTEVSLAIPDESAKKAFLKMLSVTGDVTDAAGAAGYEDDVAFFDLRVCNIGFAAEWDAAMHTAYMRLESALVSGALKAVLKPAAQTDPRTMAAWHRLAINLLAAHRRTNGQHKKFGQHGGINTKQALIAKLTQMRARNEEISANMVQNG